MGLFTAILFFGALAAIITSLRGSEDSVDAWDDAPRKLPNPGSRDMHTVTNGTLGRAHVPSWG